MWREVKGHRTHDGIFLTFCIILVFCCSVQEESQAFTILIPVQSEREVANEVRRFFVWTPLVIPSNVELQLGAHSLPPRKQDEDFRDLDMYSIRSRVISSVPTTSTQAPSIPPLCSYSHDGRHDKGRGGALFEDSATQHCCFVPANLRCPLPQSRPRRPRERKRCLWEHTFLSQKTTFRTPIASHRQGGRRDPSTDTEYVLLSVLYSGALLCWGGIGSVQLHEQRKEECSLTDSPRAEH